jgi:hypothetical protein
MEENDNIVPESTAASSRMGAPSLDADRVDNNTLDFLDKMLDEAEANTTRIYASDPAPIPETPREPDDKGGDTSDPIFDEITGQPGQFERNLPSEPNPELENITPDDMEQNEFEIDPEIAAIEQPRNLSEANQSNWKKLQETATQYKQQAIEAEELRQRLAEIETFPQQVPEDYEELKKFRAIFDTENDPEFKSKYDVPIESAKENIYNILKKNGASDDVISSIEQAGGPDKISQQWWKTQALDKLDITDSERLKKSLVDVIDLKEGRQKEIGETAEQREQFLHQRENQQVEQFYEQNRIIQEHTNNIIKDIPWANYREVKPTSSPEERAEIQKHNAAVEELSTRFNSALWPTTPQERSEVAAAAVASHVLSQQLKIEQTSMAKMQAELKRLTAENNSLKNAGRIPKANPTPESARKSTSMSDRLKMSTSDAIDFGLDEAGQ